MSEHKRNKNNRSGNQLLKTGMVWTILLAALVAVFILSIAIGSSGYPLSEVLRGLWDTEAGKIRIIVFNLRLPRAVLAIMVGACLSAAGAILQAVMRNPLADPGTIGVSAGAGAAAITILLLFPSLTYSVPLFAFGGAALACVLIYLLAWKDGVDPVRIILSGVAVNSVLGGYNAFLQLQNSDNLNGVLSFMNGSFSGGNWTQVRVMAVYAVIGLMLACFCIRNANALQLGDEMAKKSWYSRKCEPHRAVWCLCIFGSIYCFRGRNDWICRSCCTAHRKNASRFGLQSVTSNKYPDRKRDGTAC